MDSGREAFEVDANGLDLRDSGQPPDPVFRVEAMCLCRSPKLHAALAGTAQRPHGATDRVALVVVVGANDTVCDPLRTGRVWMDEGCNLGDLDPSDFARERFDQRRQLASVLLVDDGSSILP